MQLGPHCPVKRAKERTETEADVGAGQISLFGASGVAATLPAHLRNARVRDSRVSHQQQGTRWSMTTTAKTMIARNSVMRMTTTRTTEGEDTVLINRNANYGITTS